MAGSDFRSIGAWRILAARPIRVRSRVGESSGMDIKLRRTGDSGRSPLSYLGIPLAGLAIFGLAACGTSTTSTSSADPGSSPAANSQKAANHAVPPDGAVSVAKGFCRSQDLHVYVTPTPSTAERAFYQLSYHNTSAHSCVLRGYPGVSTVAGDDGHQVGHSAIRKSDYAPVTTVRIKPGGYAYSRIERPSTKNYSLARCAPRKVRGLRIYPPEETAALYVPLSGDACSDTSAGTMEVGAITGNPRQ